MLIILMLIVLTILLMMSLVLCWCCCSWSSLMFFDMDNHDTVDNFHDALKRSWSNSDSMSHLPPLTIIRSMNWTQQTKGVPWVSSHDEGFAPLTPGRSNLVDIQTGVYWGRYMHEMAGFQHWWFKHDLSFCHLIRTYIRYTYFKWLIKLSWFYCSGFCVLKWCINRVDCPNACVAGASFDSIFSTYNKHVFLSVISLLVAVVGFHSTQDANIRPHFEQAMPRHVHGAIHCFFPRNFSTTCSSPRTSADSPLPPNNALSLADIKTDSVGFQQQFSPNMSVHCFQYIDMWMLKRRTTSSRNN